MTYVPLIEYTHPRVLMLDFSPSDVSNIQKAGYEAYRGATGLHDNNEFSFPFAIQDVEVLFAQVKSGTFVAEARNASADSIEKQPYYKDLMREIWEKAGWSVLFISQYTGPEELEAIGLERLGVIAQERKHVPASFITEFQKFWEENIRYRHTAKTLELPTSQIPRFVGNDVYISENPEAKIFQRYIKSAQMSVLTCLEVPDIRYEAPQPHILTFSKREPFTWLIRDTSTDGNVTSLMLTKTIYGGRVDNQSIYNEGRILLLPDFGDNNGNVALALLQEVIPQISPHLFDTPQHPWLEKYQPVPVSNLVAEREAFVKECIQKIEQLDSQAEIEREKYAWLIGLLVSLGDEFAANVAESLRFLEFEVEEVDNILAPGERKREDLRIWDKGSNYFALGEAKTTGKGRGASEDFITRTQTHQSRYARENHQEPPPALLIINYATDLDPAQRMGRFYQEEVEGRLKDNEISAINSVALFNLCQYVLGEKLSKEQARQFIKKGDPLISSITVEDVVSTE